MKGKESCWGELVLFLFFPFHLKVSACCYDLCRMKCLLLVLAEKDMLLEIFLESDSRLWRYPGCLFSHSSKRRRRSLGLELFILGVPIFGFLWFSIVEHGRSGTGFSSLHPFDSSYSKCLMELELATFQLYVWACKKSYLFVSLLNVVESMACLP